jgi:transposase
VIEEDELMSEKRVRRKWTAGEKLRVVLLGLDPQVKVSELCRREGITANQFYTWKQQLLSSAGAVFGGKANAPSVRETKLEAENQRMKNVVAEITAENVELKKTLLD